MISGIQIYGIVQAPSRFLCVANFLFKVLANMFTTFLAGSPFPQPPRPGRQRQKRRRRSKRDTTSDRRSPSTSSGGGQKGNIRTGSSSGGAPPANNWFYEQWGTFSGSMSKAVGDLQSKTKKFEVPGERVSRHGTL